MSTPNEVKSLAFEAALQKLEDVVRTLEAGESPLEESLAQYEQGVQLLRHCYDKLRQAEQRVRIMVNEDANGNPIPEAFPMKPASAETAEPRRRPSRSKEDY
jgi:exodeoxyribonuclease VII small subunit